MDRRIAVRHLPLIHDVVWSKSLVLYTLECARTISYCKLVSAPGKLFSVNLIFSDIATFHRIITANCVILRASMLESNPHSFLVFFLGVEWRQGLLVCVSI